MMLDFNLIPNNFRYKKIFKNSNLPLEIISQDGKTRIATNHSINLRENIINDIKDNKVKNTYKDNNIVKNVKAISGGYSIEEKDFSKINEYEKELKLIQQELIEQETILQKQRKIATEIYETKLKSEIIELLDEKIEQKRDLINELIKEMMSQYEVYVFEADKMIQGFVGLNDEYIEGIFVSDEMQSCGIGKLLLDYVKDKKVSLRLNVYQKNARAISFYQREGFIIQCEDLDEDTGEKEYTMLWKRK